MWWLVIVVVVSAIVGLFIAAALIPADKVRNEGNDEEWPQ